MSNVTTKQTNAMTVADEMGAWGSENIDNNDILIPKLLLMQGMSQFVQDEKAVLGDIVNSVTGKVLGGKTKGVNIIPIMAAPKTFETYDAATNKWISSEPITPANVHLATKWEDEIDGVKVKRLQVLNFYVMVKEELEDPSAIPYLLKFKSTSYKIGKKLATHFAQSNLAKVPPAKAVFTLSSTKEQNDDGTFYVFDIKQSGTTTTEELSKVFTWYKTLKGGAVQVDMSDEVATAAPRNVTPTTRPTSSETMF